MFLQLLTVIATILDRNPELEIQQCIDLDEVTCLYVTDFCLFLNDSATTVMFLNVISSSYK